MPIFPDAIYEGRERENLAGIVYDDTKKSIVYAEDLENWDDNIYAIENYLWGKDLEDTKYLKHFDGTFIYFSDRTGVSFIIDNVASMFQIYLQYLEFIKNDISITNLNALEKIYLDSLTDCKNLLISGNGALVYLNISNLIHASTITVNKNVFLTSLSLSIGCICKNLDFSNNALLDSVVDGILDSLDHAGQSGGTVDLSGGANGSPTSAGLVSKANLVARGWTVTNN